MTTCLRLVTIVACLLLVPGCGSGDEAGVEAGDGPATSEASAQPGEQPGQEPGEPTLPAEPLPGGDSVPSEDMRPTEWEMPPQPAPPPSPPAVADQETAAGAEAFARYYFAAIDHAYATGETDLLDSLATEECALCPGFGDAIRAIYAGGGSSRGGDATITSVEVVGDPAQGPVQVALTYDTAPYEELGPEGSVDVSSPVQLGLRTTLTLTRVDGSWRVADLIDDAGQG